MENSFSAPFFLVRGIETVDTHMCPFFYFANCFDRLVENYSKKKDFEVYIKGESDKNTLLGNP